MGERDREAFGVGKVLKLLLPPPISHAIGATTISSDEQRVFAWVERFARQVPPFPDTFHRKLRRVMIDAHIHEALVMHQIIHPRRNSFSVSERKKVRHVDVGCFSLSLPFPPGVLEIAKQFLFRGPPPR